MGDVHAHRDHGDEVNEHEPPVAERRKYHPCASSCIGGRVIEQVRANGELQQVEDEE